MRYLTVLSVFILAFPATVQTARTETADGPPSMTKEVPQSLPTLTDRKAIREAELNIAVMDRGYNFYLVRNQADQANSYLHQLVQYVRVQSAKLGVPSIQLVKESGIGGEEYWKVLQETVAATPLHIPQSQQQDKGVTCDRVGNLTFCDPNP